MKLLQKNIHLIMQNLYQRNYSNLNLLYQRSCSLEIISITKTHIIEARNGFLHRNISLNMEVTIIPPWFVLRLKSELLHKYLSWFVGEKLQFQKMERFGVFIAILLSLKLLLQINICSIITKCHLGFHYNIEHYRQSVIQ